jgi:hypothetical protein
LREKLLWFGTKNVGEIDPGTLLARRTPVSKSTYEVTFHPELVQRRRVVHSNLRFLSVVPDPHADVIAAPLAPYVERHLKSDDQDAHVQLPGSLAQRMNSHKFIEPANLGIVVRRVVLVLTFAFTHFEKKKVTKLERKKSQKQLVL